MRKGILGTAVVLALAASGIGMPAHAAGPAATVIAQNTPGFIKSAKDLGPVDPATVISVTAWLKLHNESQLDQLVRQQTTKGSPNFHKWISQSQFNSQFAPTANDLRAVQNWLNAHNLTTIAVAENNFYVKVQGTVGDVERAFHVSIDNFALSDGSTYRSNTGNPSVNDSSGNHVAAITGLDNYGFQPQNVSPVGPDGRPYARQPLATGTPNGAFFAHDCFRAPETHTFTDSSATATYSGNRYGSDITSDVPNLPPCGYQPSEVQSVYNMQPLYDQGLDGTGETIVIVDAYGSPTIESDATLFSEIYGLPPVDLTIVKAPGLQNNPHAGTWADETTLDVEWSHAMAPGAKIALVVATDRASLDEAINLAVVRHLGNTISNSWSTVEGFGNPAQLGRVERILQMAAAQGIDVNFSSGDDGDETLRVGFQSVDYPASSTYATGIGGTSLAMDADNNLSFETGWGNNQTRIAKKVSEGGGPENPPVQFGFIFGAGGGSSLTFAKPAFQSSLAGSTRQVPDISMLADPFTGVEIIITDPTVGPVVGVIGGTSLSCPMFSGVMAIAAQKAGGGLGQAAPLVYGLAGVRDILPPNPANNVSGSITDTSGTTLYTSDDLIDPETTVAYLTALYNGTSTRWYTLSFNTDSSLFTAAGWDNVTGVGVPDGVNFVNAIAP